eukprot:sb/3465240/
MVFSSKPGEWFAQARSFINEKLSPPAPPEPDSTTTRPPPEPATTRPGGTAATAAPRTGRAGPASKSPSKSPSKTPGGKKTPVKTTPKKMVLRYKLATSIASIFILLALALVLFLVLVVFKAAVEAGILPPPSPERADTVGLGRSFYLPNTKLMGDIGGGTETGLDGKVVSGFTLGASVQAATNSVDKQELNVKGISLDAYSFDQYWEFNQDCLIWAELSYEVQEAFENLPAVVCADLQYANAFGSLCQGYTEEDYSRVANFQTQETTTVRGGSDEVRAELAVKLNDTLIKDNGGGVDLRRFEQVGTHPNHPEYACKLAPIGCRSDSDCKGVGLACHCYGDSCVEKLEQDGPKFSVKVNGEKSGESSEFVTLTRRVECRCHCPVISCSSDNGVLWGTLRMAVYLVADC